LSTGHASRRRSTGQQRGGSPVAVGAALEAFVRELGIAPTLKQYDALTSWPEVVGEQIARVTSPERIENGILIVHVGSASWRSELSMRRMEIISKLNARAGAPVIREIRFR